MVWASTPDAGQRPPVTGADADLSAALLAAMDLPVLAVSTGDRRLFANPAARDLFALPATGDLALSWLADLARRLHTADGGPAVDEDSLPLLRALDGSAVDDELVLVRPGRSPRHLLLRGRSVIAPDGGIGGAVCTVHDLSLTAERQAHLARRTAGMAAVTRAARAVLAGEDARHAVCAAARDVCGPATVGLYEADGDGRMQLTARTTGPDDAPDLATSALPLVAGVLRARRPLVLVDARAVVHRREPHDPGLPPQAVLLPLVVRGRAVAVLSVVGHGPGLADHVPVLEALADEAAAALEQQDLLRRLRREAASDSLTGAATRRVWEERLPAALEAARRTLRPLAVVMLDLDHFKLYNDTHGHLAGDDLLREAVAAWRSRLHGDDLLCRYGGEEFLVLAPGRGDAAARALAEALRCAVPRRQTCSAGVAVWDGSEDAESLVRRADGALYAAKLGGRDRVRLAPAG